MLVSMHIRIIILWHFRDLHTVFISIKYAITTTTTSALIHRARVLDKKTHHAHGLPEDKLQAHPNTKPNRNPNPNLTPNPNP